MSDLEIIIECCKHLGLTKEEAKTVLQIAHSPEERSDLVVWMRENIKASPEPIYVIIAAGEIQMKHRDKSKSPMFNSIILHIPHASSNFEFARHDQYVSSWRKEAEPLIDWYTDELFIPTDCDEIIIPIVFDTCRTLVDVERMCNDPLECRELGITAYRLLRGKDGGNIVRIDDEEDIRYMKKYLDHQHKLAHLLVDHPNSLLIDCHSFSSRPTILQPDASKNEDVEICIGFNEDSTKPSDDVLTEVTEHFRERGYKVSLNVPFSNSKTVETPASYTSLMIEVNKAIYMDEDTLEKKDSFGIVRDDITSLYEKLLEDC